MNTHPSHPVALVSNPLRSRSRWTRRARGFTLVELLVGLAVAAVLLAVGVPSLNALLDSSRLTAASNSLLSSMHLARSEAIKRNSRVALCKSGNGISCSGTGGWEQGWIVFHDANNDGARGSDEAVIQRIQPLAGSVRLKGNSNVARYVSFLATGATKTIGGGFQAGTLTVCNQSASRSEARQIILNAAGRPRVQTASVNSCA